MRRRTSDSAADGAFLPRALSGCRGRPFGHGDGVAVERAGCFELVLQPGQILRSMRPPSGPNSGPSIRIQPFGCTCQSQLRIVPSPSAAKVSAPEVSIFELVVREPSRCGRSYRSAPPASACPPGPRVRGTASPPRWAAGRPVRAAGPDHDQGTARVRAPVHRGEPAAAGSAGQGGPIWPGGW